MAIRVNQGDDGLVENHEINVTPFIDVMLVLLIIFMVTAPLSTVDVPVKLPVASAEPKPPSDKPVFVSLQADGAIFVGEQEVAKSGLAAAVTKASGGNKDLQLFLRADKTVDYGRLMDLLNTLRDAGYLKVALVGLQANGGGAQSGG